MTRTRTLLLTVAALAALALPTLGTGRASAALSCAGDSIVGAGASLQAPAQQLVWPQAFADVCAEPTVSYEDVGSAAGMQLWNFDGSKTAIDTERPFIATDAAPTASQIGNVEATASSPLVVVPVAQTAIAILADPPPGCTVKSITNKQLQQAFLGAILRWSELSTATGSCEAALKRVVRRGGAGTTYQLKRYLSRYRDSALPCTGGRTWLDLQPIDEGTNGTPNISWPQMCPERKLSKLIYEEHRGDAGIIREMGLRTGTISYASLPEVERLNDGAAVLAVQNNGLGTEAPTFADPAVGGLANCAAAQYEVPQEARRSEPLASGLGVDWSQVYGSKPGIGGSDYPLCTLTFDLAFDSYEAAGFRYRQELTLHDYLTEFIVQTAGQEALAKSGSYYAALPTSAQKAYDVLGSARFVARRISWE